MSSFQDLDETRSQ